MNRHDLIILTEAAELCNLSEEVLKQFSDFGFFRTYVEENQYCINCNDLEEVRRISRLYRDLNINLEGIEIILSMRQQIIDLKQTIDQLSYKLQKVEQERNLRLFEEPLRNGLIIDFE